MAPSTDHHRWAQLTYASFDPGNGVGGWQVKQSRGDLTPAELRDISAHLVTAFDSHVPMPEYPTPEDIAAQPRRCTHLLAHGGALGAGAGSIGAVTAGCTLHAVQAGSDSTGRPGNVFSHVVLDRRPARADPRLRPIELWRSFDLLTPYGTSEVLAATLRSGEYPAPSGLVGRDLVLDFIFDPSTWRMGVLSVLLDAVLESMYGGRRVALVTAGSDQAAMWIAAVSWCMAASTARRLSWSVYERASRLGDAFNRGVHLACVPRDDAMSLDHEDAGVIVLDDREMPSLGQFDVAPHRTAAGHEVAATPWSLLAQEAFIDAPTASGILALLDDLAERAGEAVLTPAWPLAMAHLMSAPDGADTALAARVSVADAPDGELDPWIAEVIDRAAITGFDDSTEAAWAAASSARPDSRVAALLLVEYVCRAFADPSWLTRPEGVPLVANVGESAGDGRVRERFDDALVTSEPAALLRAVDLGARLGLLDDADTRRRATDALTARVAPAMLRGGHEVGPIDDGEASRESPGFLERVGTLDPVVHLELVPESLRAAMSSPLLADEDASGPLLEDAAAAWIVERGLPEPLAQPENATAEMSAVAHEDRLGDELVAWVARHRLDVSGAGYTVADRLLRRFGTWFGIPPELRLVGPMNLWRLDELIALEGDHPGGLPERFFEPALACSPASPQLSALATLIERRGLTRVAGVAALRLEAEGAGSREPFAVRERVELVAALYAAARTHFAVSAFAPVVLEAAVLDVAASLTDHEWPPAMSGLLHASASTPDALQRTSMMIADRLAGARDETHRDRVAHIVALDAATDPAVADRLGAPLAPAVREIGALVDANGARLVAHLAAALLSGLDETTTDAVFTDAIRGLVRVHGDADERSCAELERYVRQRYAAASRRGGDGWFRPFRPRQSKEH